jgi:hypothetical protein
MNPHRYTGTGGDAMTTLGWQRKSNLQKVFLTVALEPLYTHTVPVYDYNFNDFNCAFHTYRMYISSLICFKDQL